MKPITQIIIFTLWISSSKARISVLDDLPEQDDALLYDYPTMSTNLEPLQQSSGIHEIRKELRMLRRQTEKILRQLQTNSAAPIIVDKYTKTGNYFPKNCKDVQERGHNTTNVYLIKPDLSSKIFPVVCDMDKRGGGWAYLLNRFDGAEDFDLDWNKYKDGFGNLNEEFWLGLDNIHFLTGYEVNELLVELVDFNNTTAYAHYDLFGVGSEKEGYSLKVLGGYDGTAGDSLTFSAKMEFLTKDQNRNRCGTPYGAAWWHTNCMNDQTLSALTGEYGDMEASVSGNHRMQWGTFQGLHGLKQARMMVRPRWNRNNPILLTHGNH